LLALVARTECVFQDAMQRAGGVTPAAQVVGRGRRACSAGQYEDGCRAIVDDDILRPPAIPADRIDQTVVPGAKICRPNGRKALPAEPSRADRPFETGFVADAARRCRRKGIPAVSHVQLHISGGAPFRVPDRREDPGRASENGCIRKWGQLAGRQESGEERKHVLSISRLTHVRKDSKADIAPARAASIRLAPGQGISAGVRWHLSLRTAISSTRSRKVEGPVRIPADGWAAGPPIDDGRLECRINAEDPETFAVGQPGKELRPARRHACPRR
jgi:hypothetical protein